MRPIAVLDAETDPFKRDRVPAPFVWGFYDGSEYHTFTDTAKVVDFLRAYDGIVYAHNGGRFDWHFILPYIDPYESVMLINGRIARFKLGACECRDSYNLLPIPLGAYKKDEIDYTIMEADQRDKPANKRKIAAYLKSDCVYLWDLITQFVERYGLHLTQAGASMKQWRKISGAEVPRTTKEFYEQLSPYYYGGRVECFESGIVDTGFSVFDINSAYPFAMLERHPYSDNFAHVEGYAKGADFYKVRCISQGAFPYRGDGRFAGAGLSFPDDNESRIYTITHWEYAAARETKTIRNVTVLESLTFTGHTDFSAYVNHFYAERAKCKAAGDEAGSLFAKLFMNSLYGKMAADPSAYKEHTVIPMDVICALSAICLKCGTKQRQDYAERCYRCGVFMAAFAGEFGPWGLAEQPLEEHRQRYYNVATGASITGYVRAMLWRAICASGGVLYCDTDSIAARTSSVPLGADLGQWKHEGDFDRAGIAGKKLYVFRGVKGSGAGGRGRAVKMASKGVRLTEAELWKVAKGRKVTYHSETPTFSPKKAPAFVSREVTRTA